ncbi:lipase [Vibrio europaeus]|uniref:alpha/beta fold hydrolase n=2 Tax=Vibrio europaeus TaxID=300876 RepID=UPI00233E6DB9|nr:alpha/beta fold hydrolase [Vibrio europaeus]MDC5821346.1 lipase [Vibrio europaeus]
MRGFHSLSLAISAITLLSGCGSEESTSDNIAVEVPFSLSSIPMPNDGYGYDADGTISLPGEPSSPNAYSTNVEYAAYYQNFETSFAAVDGWGLCVEPIEVPLSSVGSEQVLALDPQSIITEKNSATDTVMLFKEGDPTPLDIKVTNDGRSLSIQCGEALNLDTPTRYHLIVTSGVKTETGQPLNASSEFTRLMNSSNEELNDSELVVKQDSIAPAVTHYRSLASAGIAYAATFTTQDAYSPLDEMVEANSNASVAIKAATFDDSNSNYEFVTGVLTSKQYLPFDQQTADTDPAGCVLDEYDPIASCPAMYRWITPEDTSQGEHLTKLNPNPRIHNPAKKLPVNIYLPKGTTPLDAEQTAKNNPAVIFVHGLGGDMSSTSLMAADYTNKGYVVFAIDMPYHGSQIVKDNNDNEISANANRAFFINITSPLTLRSNLHQAVADFIGLRYALNFGNPHAQREVSLIGQSLGGIVSVMITEMTQGKDALSLNTANYVVPGQGLVNLTLNSLLLGPEMERAIKDSPDIQRAIAETLVPNLCYEGVSNEDCINALNDHSASFPDSIAMLEEEIYAAVLPLLKKGVQRTIDSADPAGKVYRQVSQQQPTLLLEAFGTCKNDCEVGIDYIPDSVVPNSAPNNQLTGTEPLIRALKLDPILDDVPVSDIRGVVRATKGGHGTYLFPYEGPVNEDGVPEQEITIEGMQAMAAQQLAISSMVIDQKVTLRNNYFVDSSDFN